MILYIYLYYIYRHLRGDAVIRSGLPVRRRRISRIRRFFFVLLVLFDAKTSRFCIRTFRQNLKVVPNSRYCNRGSGLNSRLLSCLQPNCLNPYFRTRKRIIGFSSLSVEQN